MLLLAPSAELWTHCLRHRTQILYLADISMAVAFMELRPGCEILMNSEARSFAKTLLSAACSAILKLVKSGPATAARLCMPWMHIHTAVHTACSALEARSSIL